MDGNSLLYTIALSLVPGVGSITAKKLISYTGNIEAVFRQKKAQLLCIPDIGEILADRILHSDVLSTAEKEIKFIDKFKIKALGYLDPDYPERLRQCEDSPLVLYRKGEVDLNAGKIIAMVGTRQATPYGCDWCDKLVSDLTSRGHQFVVVSGLAFGIDIASHRASIRHRQPTVAVLGHGLNTIYPAEHTTVAREIARQGALVTDFISQEKPERNNFLRRNRIIAGLSDATIVVESAEKGGSLITAEIAGSYNREVLAVPGRVGDPFSRGCNDLIRSNRAALISSAEDLEYFLGWEKNGPVHPQQTALFTELTGDDQRVYKHLRQHGPSHIDELSLALNIPVQKLAGVLLNLEFLGNVKSLPGNIFQIR